MKLIQMLKGLFGTKKVQPKPAEGQSPSNNGLLQQVMNMLANTREVEMTCDEVFSVLDQFAELAAQGVDVSQAMPLVKHHLGMCPDCREEYEALERILQNTA